MLAGMSETFRIVVTVTAAGMIGGLLYATSLHLTRLRKGGVPPGWWTRLRSSESFPYAFIGAGGAWAALLAMLWAKRAPLDYIPEDILELIATSILAGYSGNRVLPAMADRLAKELLEKTARDAESAADDARSSRIISEVIAYLDDKGSQTGRQTSVYIETLKGVLKNTPGARKASILLARLYTEQQKKPQEAIKVLEDFIATRTSAGKPGDGDVADAYWNIANYYEQMFAAHPDQTNRKQAIDALAHSISITPQYRQNLMSDDDFKALRSDTEARTILNL